MKVIFIKSLFLSLFLSLLFGCGEVEKRVPQDGTEPIKSNIDFPLSPTGCQNDCPPSFFPKQ